MLVNIVHLRHLPHHLCLDATSARAHARTRPLARQRTRTEQWCRCARGASESASLARGPPPRPSLSTTSCMSFLFVPVSVSVSFSHMLSHHELEALGVEALELGAVGERDEDVLVSRQHHVGCGRGERGERVLVIAKQHEGWVVGIDDNRCGLAAGLSNKGVECG